MPKISNNHIKEFNKATEYIEEKIKNSEEITNESIANEFGYEQHYFSRVFQKYSSMTIQEYIKKRKMSHALIDLLRTDDSISNIAEKYLYSADGFTKAFNDIFGTTPLKAKKRMKNSTVSDDNYFDHFLNRAFVDDYSEYIDGEIKCKISVGEDMKFVGISDIEDPKVYEAFELISSINNNGKFFMIDNYENGEIFPPECYYANYYTPFSDYNEEAKIIEIPKRNWLILSARGTNRGVTISALSTYARYEWINQHNDYIIEDGYEIGFQTADYSNYGLEEDMVRCELWVPIKEKS